MPNQPRTPTVTVRLDADLINELNTVAQLTGTDRSAIIRDGARRELRRIRRLLERDSAMRQELRAITGDHAHA